MARCSRKDGKGRRCKREARPGLKLCEKCAARGHRYDATEAGKERRRQYNTSEAGKERNRRYNATEAGKERQRRYDASEAGKERMRRLYTRSLARRVQTWLNRDKIERCPNPPAELEPTMYNARMLLEWIRSLDGNYYCGAKRGGCKELIDTLQCRNGDAPSLDHVLSRLEAHARGVDWHTVENLQLMHKRCHQAKTTVTDGDLYVRELVCPRRRV